MTFFNFPKYTHVPDYRKEKIQSLRKKLWIKGQIQQDLMSQMLTPWQQPA